MCTDFEKKNRQWEIYFELLLSANTKFSEQSSKKLASSRLSALRLKDPFSLTVMLCALFVVKRGHWPEQPLLDQFMASDLSEEMDTETEISEDIRNLLPRKVL